MVVSRFVLRHKYVFAAVGALILLVGWLRLTVETDPGTTELTAGDGHVLVVLAPPLGGIEHTAPGLKRLIRETFPAADLLVATYAYGWFSNADPLELTDVLERGIRNADDAKHYERIVVIGYSLGGVIARKALLWGHGYNADRTGGGRVPLERHAWVDRVDRFVSIAAPNRGWRNDNPPEHNPLWMNWIAVAMEHFGRLTDTGRLVRSVLAGTPFVANMRVQWIHLARDLKERMPLVVHLLGKRDELVQRDDSLDLAAAEGVQFKTLPSVGHLDIARELLRPDNGKLSETGAAIVDALTLSRGGFPPGWADADGEAKRKRDPAVKHVVYIMHGIRDEGDWTDVIETRVLQLAGGERAAVVIPPAHYKRFAMLPFLLYWDRQQNVRRFMDQYTQDLASYPNLESVDYFGHSNGTYILASALQRYATLKVRNVLFAGSVVPSHYNWQPLIDAGRVVNVRNIVADRDWVVAIFPQLFETISQTVEGREEPQPGLFDIGAAGFRGFIRATAEGPVRNVTFVAGAHGAGVEVVGLGTPERKLDAIATYLSAGDDTKLATFRETTERSPALLMASNVSWLIWLVILAVTVGIGYVAARLGRMAVLAYIALLFGLLLTV